MGYKITRKVLSSKYFMHYLGMLAPSARKSGISAKPLLLIEMLPQLTHPLYPQWVSSYPLLYCKSTKRRPTCSNYSLRQPSASSAPTSVKLGWTTSDIIFITKSLSQSLTELQSSNGLPHWRWETAGISPNTLYERCLSEHVVFAGDLWDKQMPMSTWFLHY